LGGVVLEKEIVMSKSFFRPAPTRRLPQHPNLEQLRKQAKDLLEQYCSGDSAATAEIQNFERNPDPSTFALMMHSGSWRGLMAMKAGPN